MTEDITFTGTITISGNSNVTIKSVTGAKFISDRSFVSTYGGLFYIDSGEVTFSGVQFVSGSAIDR